MVFADLLVIWVFLITIGLTFGLEYFPSSKYVPSVWALVFIPVALSTSGILPSETPVYGSIVEVAVPVGVALLLLRASILDIIRKTGPMLGYYFIGVIGSLVGTGIGLLLFDLGAEEAGLGAAMIAYLAGSTVNVVAVSQAVQMDATVFSALFASSIVVLPLYLAIVMMLMRAPFIAKFLRFEGNRPQADEGSTTEGMKPSPSDDKRKAGALGPLVALTYALGVYLGSRFVMEALDYPQYTVLAVTVAAIFFGNVFPGLRRFMSGDRELGAVALYFFICALSAQMDLGALGGMAGQIILFWFAAIAVHFAVMLIAGRLLRVDPDVLFLASNAGVGGPSTTAALAAAQRRPELITPGILCSLCGIVIGTFLGAAWFAIAS